MKIIKKYKRAFVVLALGMVVFSVLELLSPWFRAEILQAIIIFVVPVWFWIDVTGVELSNWGERDDDN